MPHGLGPRGGFLIAGLAVALLSGGAAAETITVVNNGGTVGEAQRQAFFDRFTEVTGIEILSDAYDQELAKIRAQVETGNLIWDVSNVTVINEATGCEEGLFERIDWSQHLDPAAFEEVGGFARCGMPYIVSPGGLVYDADELSGDDAPQSWADFWDIERWPGKRGLLYRAEQTLEVALMADGVPPNQVMEVLAAPGGVDRAFNKLAELKPHIHWWKSGDESMQLILTGEVVMTYGWQGRVAAANKSNGRNLRIQWRAGYVSGNIYFTVMKGTEHEDVAIRFIQFVAEPERQAEFSQLIGYSPANKRAYDYLTEEQREQLPVKHLDRASLQVGDLYRRFWLDNGDALLQRFVQFVAR